MSFDSLLTTVACLFILIVIGFVARKIGWITDDMIKPITDIVLHICQPFLIIYSIAKQEFSLEKLKTGLMFVGLGILVHLILSIISFLLTRFIGDDSEKKVSEFTIIFANCGFVGFPILRAVLGDIGLFYGAFFIISFHLSVWTWGVSIFARGRKDIKLTPKKILINFGTIPSLIGLAIYLSTLRLPDFLANACSYLAETCTPLSLLIVGALIATKSLKEIFGNWKVYYISAIKLLICPIIICLLCKLIGFEDYITIFLTIMASLPSASLGTMFAKTYDTNPEYASLIVSVTTVFCAGTIPLIMKLCDFIVSI